MSAHHLRTIMAGAKPSTPLMHTSPLTWLGLSQAPHIPVITPPRTKQFICAQVYIDMTFRWHNDGGCYFLSRDDFNHLLHYTVVRRQMVEEFHTLLVSAEAQLHHTIRLIADSLPSYARTQDTHQLQELLISYKTCPTVHRHQATTLHYDARR